MSRNTRKLKSRLAAGALALSALVAGLAELAAQPVPGASPRIALVIGEAAYKTGPLSSAANDAGLVADTLHLAGFDVTGAADLDQDGLRRSLREFVEKAAAAGPDAVVFIYLSGRAVQYAGENYLAPIEATIPRASNVPLEAVRLSDYLQPLAKMPLRARIVVLDASRINAFAQSGEPLAGGVALVEPDTGSLYATNAAPDSVAPNETGPYGVYAQALTEMLREGGLPVDAAFARTRLRVSEQTKGALVPWDESKLAPAPVLFARAPGAPPPAVAIETQANMRARPIRDYPVDQAYAAALEQDTLAGYVDFVNAYPNCAYASRVRAMLAVRREAVTWRRAWLANTPAAYWTYLQRYPRGPHAGDARLRLASINAALMAPPRFEAYEFDVPPPVEEEEVYFRRPYVVFNDPDWGAPPPMGYLLPSPPIMVESAPPPPPYAGLLPLPLLAAPLLFALPAVRQGLFHAPAVVQTQQPRANSYYNSRNNRAQAQPGAAPVANPSLQQPAQPIAPAAPALGTPFPRGGPGAAPNGAPLPHAAPGAAPNGAPLPHAAPGAAPNGAPLPHAAPGAAPNGAPLPHVAPGAAPSGATLPHAAPGAALPATPAGSAFPRVAPAAGTPSTHTAPSSPPAGAPLTHVAPAGAPLHHAAPPALPSTAPAPHVVTPAPAAPHLAPPAPHPAAVPHVVAPPHPAAPPQPHFAAPPPHVAAPPPPHVAAPPPHPHANCGAPGQPPCR
jgi:uncharacterized caspase-like protein